MQREHQQQPGESHSDDTPADLNSVTTPNQVPDSRPMSSWVSSINEHENMAAINVEHGEDA